MVNFDKLKSLSEIKGVSLSFVSLKIGCNRNYLSECAKKHIDIPNERLVRITEILGTSVSYLRDETDDPSQISRKPKGVKIPVLGRIIAGIPIEAIEDIIDYEEIPEEMAKNGEYFALQVIGDSMEPRFVAGDIVIIRKQETADTGNIVVALIDGENATIKKLQRLTQGISLVSLNPKYSPMNYTNHEIIEKPVTIIGKVVELRAKF